MDHPSKIIVQLYSEELDSTEENVLFFPTFPSTFQEIMDKIEESFFIPSCLQTVWVHGSKVHESVTCSPSSLYLQSGDTIKISYPLKCEVDRVKNAVKWLADNVSSFQEINNCTKVEQVDSLFDKHSIFRSKTYLQQFENLFFPWTDKAKDINTIYFDYLGGIDLLVKTQKEAIAITKNSLLSCSNQYNISTLLRYMRLLESACCIALANIAKSSEYCRRITERGGLDTCIEVFLINLDNHKEWMTSVDDALGAISNISDIPENHLYISQRKDVISQIPTVISRPSDFSIWAANDAVNILMNVTQCREAHVEFLQPDMIQEVIRSLNCRKHISGRINMSVRMLFWYASISQAQMVLGSTYLLQDFPEPTLQSMIELMKEVCTYDPRDIKIWEDDIGMSWTSFQNLLFLYEADVSSCVMPRYPSINQVCSLATEVLLRYFQCTLGTKESIEVANKEGLLEYFIMLPWIVPAVHQEQAKCVVREISSVHQIQPPSLSSLSRAKVAKMKLGLKKLEGINAISQLLSDLSTS